MHTNRENKKISKKRKEKGKKSHIPFSVELLVWLQAEWLSSRSDSCLPSWERSPRVDQGQNERNLLQLLLENLRAQGKETGKVINVALLLWFQSPQSQLRMAVRQDKAATNQSLENSAFVLGNTFWYFCLWYLKNQINRHLVHWLFFPKQCNLMPSLLTKQLCLYFAKTFQHMADKKLFTLVYLKYINMQMNKIYLCCSQSW